MVENLKIYNNSLNLVTSIYQLISGSSSLSKDYSLCDQLKRAAVSVPTNISEGYCRTKKHFKSYLKISSGSANEVITLLRIVCNIYKLNTEDLQNEYKILAKQISAFSSSFN
jgi:four helix bundle protein